MSAVTAINRRYLIGIALGLLVALLLGLGVLQWTQPGGGGGGAARAPEAPPGSVAAPRIEQARWEIRAQPVGTLSRPSKKARQRFQAQRKPLGETVRDIYNSVFLAPSSAPGVVRRSFTQRAAAALGRLKVGLPARAEGVRMKRRTAALAIDMAGAARATAKVRLVAKATVGGERVALKHVAALYLTRQGRGWTVFAFEIDQGPWEREHEKARHRGDKERGKGTDGRHRRGRDAKRSRKGGKR